MLGGLNAFYLLVDKPEIYGLPSAPKLPSRSVPRSSFWGIFAAFLTALGAVRLPQPHCDGSRAVANGTLPRTATSQLSRAQATDAAALPPPRRLQS